MEAGKIRLGDLAERLGVVEGEWPEGWSPEDVIELTPKGVQLLIEEQDKRRDLFFKIADEVNRRDMG